jgi:surfactin family lipopeptide synthetase C
MDKKNIEAVYPLSPMQEGILFHSLYSTETNLYFGQSTFKLSGELNIAAFAEAWHQLILRHEVFRTAFVWEKQKQPIQIVLKQVRFPWAEEDWQAFSPSEQQNKLEDINEGDRQQGFTLSQAPLVRFKLIRLNKTSYYFIWSYHIILLDGWSIPLVYKEVITRYQALKNGEKLHLDKPRPYRDYIAWLKHQDLSRSEIFWRKILAGFTNPISLERRAVAQYEFEQKETYSKQAISFSAATTTKLNQFVKQHQLTINTLIQGAWAILLSRYSGEKDVVFGATVSGRPPALEQVDSIVGSFINTIPVRVKIDYNSNLLSWLRQIQIQQVEARQYEYTPLIEIQKWSDIPLGIPLFESILVTRNYPSRVFSESNIDLKIYNLDDYETANYPLILSVELESELTIHLECNKNIYFDGVTIQQILTHLKTFLKNAIAAQPLQSLADLSMLTASEQQQLLVEWNDTQKEYPADVCIYHLFEQQVKRSPDRIAIVFEDQQLTYQELDDKANQLACYLQQLGVKAEVPVGIYLERSLEMSIAILGILKAGGAYIPIDPAYPLERVATILEDAQIKLILSQSRLETRLTLNQTKCINLDRISHLLARHSSDRCLDRCNAQNIAYVIYTSGSTGKPKGVAVNHQALVNYTLDIAEQFELQACDRVLQFAAVGFDVVVEEIFPTWIKGATLVFPSTIEPLSCREFQQLITREQLTVFELPTAYWHQWVLELFSSVETVPGCVRLAIVGGERISPERLKQWQTFQTPLIHVYGLTETTVTSTLYRLASNTQQRDIKELPIGSAIANTQIYLLDSHLQPVPVGVPGELYIGGAGLARGYLNRADITAEKFIPHPFSREAGARLYKTGDKARYLSDGNVEFLDRLDRQIKIRGFRVELGEIESVLSQIPEVKDCVVIDREDVPAQKRLVAYLVSSSQQLAIAQLRSFLKQQLPDYTIPSAFVQLEALPLTSNGKIDRRALPVPDPTRHELKESFIAPRSPFEEAIADIWCQVLHIERVGIHDNFFDLGGHSLIATQLVSRLRDAFEVELPLRSIFESPTIAELAIAIVQNQIEQMDNEEKAQFLQEAGV